MVLNCIIYAALIVVLISQIACDKTMPSLDMNLANEALQEYCRGENISPCSFNDANVYREKNMIGALSLSQKQMRRKNMYYYCFLKIIGLSKDREQSTPRFEATEYSTQTEAMLS